MPSDQPQTQTKQTEAEFAVLLRVRYAECDAQNVVFNARYGDYVDLVATEFYRSVFGGYQRLIDQGIDTQVVSLKTDWTAPAHFDDVLHCAVTVEKIGRTSFTLNIAFKDFHSTQNIAQATIVYVTVTPRDHQKQTIPDFVRRGLEVGAPGQLINLAGSLSH